MEERTSLQLPCQLNKNTTMKKSIFFFNYKAQLFFKLLLGCLLLFGCNFSDSSKELSGDYFYRNEGDHVKDIICHRPNSKNIYSEILSYDYNSEYIVAIQHPNYEEYKTQIGFELRGNLKRYPTNSVEERIQSEVKSDSILKHDPYYKSIFAHKINYWIIAHKKKEVYGPLTKEEYIQKRSELGVPEDLEVKTE